MIKELHKAVMLRSKTQNEYQKKKDSLKKTLCLIQKLKSKLKSAEKSRKVK